MITPERIAEIENQLVGHKGGQAHMEHCAANYKRECNCVYSTMRDLLKELKESLAREEKNKEEIARFAKKLSTWIEEQIV